jgi:BlaI family transcriptional regulator, penicillinase repressor
MIKRDPSKLEMQVLSVLWQRGPSSVRDVLDAMSDGKSRAYTTILTVMQVMEKKGLVSHTAQGNTHIYAAAISRDQVAGPLLKDLVRHLFGGSRVTALQHLLKENEVTPGELDEIKQLIASHEKESSSRRKKRS